MHRFGEEKTVGRYSPVSVYFFWSRDVQSLLRRGCRGFNIHKEVFFMRRYETVFILDPDLSDEIRESVMEKLSDIIQQYDGFTVEYDHWGGMTLAYEIKRKTRGYYVRAEYCGDGDLVKEIERSFRIDDRVMKYLTVLLDSDIDVEKVKAEIEAARSEREKQDQEKAEAAAAAEAQTAESKSEAAEETSEAPSEESTETQTTEEE